MIVLLAVLALIVVNALKSSPWGLVTIGLTIPIAMLMGVYLRWMRPGRVLEASAIGIVLIVFALFAGQWAANQPSLAAMFTLSGTAVALAVMAYGFVASVLPVWLLLAPRDYLSAFVKIGVVLALAVGIIISLPPLHMPALTQFIDGSGPVFAGKVFPFAFITIACGAISGFHALVASGTTPKMLQREPDARMIGYGGDADGIARRGHGAHRRVRADAGHVLRRSMLPPASIGTTAASAAEAVRHWGFTLDPTQMETLARQVGEKTLLSRTGGAPSLALGMAQLFANVLGGSGALALWYHFAIMFEALFILTTLDAGTRVGRFMVQDLGKHLWAPLGRVSWYPAVVISSALIVAMWGHFLYQGILDPLGGINSLWPLFGISNQLLATVALCVATTIFIKMGKARFAWITLMPMAWLFAVTMTAGWQKLFAPDVKLGFLSHAHGLEGQLASGALPAAIKSIADARRMIFNDYLDAVVTMFFMVSVVVIIADSTREWMSVLRGRKPVVSSEAPFEAIPVAGD